MQPRLPEEFNNTEQELEATRSPSTTTQHGRPSTTNSTSPSPPSDNGEGGVSLSPAGTSSDVDQDSPADHAAAATIRGLSLPAVALPPTQNRIAEYENATIPTPRRRAQGPNFEVVRKARQPGDRSSPISDFPNEILTHALSHLSPTDLTAVSLVSRRFRDLVTTPFAWRSAFARFFPGPETLTSNTDLEDEDENDEVVKTERRAYTRLTALASWRSEYILRTRLLRSLARGKPIQTIASPAAARTGQSHIASPMTTYSSQLYTIVNHLDANFGTGLNKRLPRFVHGADDIAAASSSDPMTGKTDSWGLSDPVNVVQFADRFPGDAQYGLGTGEVVGVPNVMDVSQPYGMMVGEGIPDGMVYYRFAEEMRGRFLASSGGLRLLDLGIPKIHASRECQCSVWIAKTEAIPTLTDGMVGLMAGSSLGILTAYSLGPLRAKDKRFGRGEMTARWALCPGVPIIRIVIDEQYSMKRQAQNRIWAVVLNALGEVFYLTKFPTRQVTKPMSIFDDEAREQLAWASGRSVYWKLAEPTRRQAKPNPYRDSMVDGSYSPRGSWNGMCLSKEQIRAETSEIEGYLAMKPKDFQANCLGWDMRRRLEVDFANDDGHNAGEAILVIETGLNEDTVSRLSRFTRLKVADETITEPLDDIDETASVGKSQPATSLFGGIAEQNQNTLDAGTSATAPVVRVEPEASLLATTEEWRTSQFSFDNLRNVQITSSTVDCSTFATLTASEDPHLNFSGRSTSSSPSLTPLSQADATSGDASDIPGQRSRLVAVGTKLGTVMIWNMRAPTSSSADIVNTIDPIRIIHTDSPEISCLAMSALYVVHGGNDGLVQAWDPLGSQLTPVRTFHSRFSSRARRRLQQAEASAQGVGINMFAAGAICIDPDPTVLRGVVSLGNQLRYWSFSSSAADEYRSHKRRIRRSERGSNSGNDRPTPVASGNIKKFIANEKFEMELEEERRHREVAHLAGRFGTELLGENATEEEMLAYAALLSEESMAKDAERRASHSTAIARSERSVSPAKADVAGPEADDPDDPDVAEAIRRSLAADHDLSFDDADLLPDIPIRVGKPRKRSPTPKHSPALPSVAEGSNAREDDDLEFALQLSLAEEQSREAAASAELDDYPDLTPSQTQVWGGNGKGKGRAS